MKKLKLFALGLIGASMMMTSCADDSEDPIGPNLSVTTNGAAGSSIEVSSSDMLHFEWRADAGDAKLKTFEIYRDAQKLSIDSTDNDNDLTNDISNSNNETYKDGVVLSALAGVYTFEVTDKDGESSSVEITVSVGTSMNNEVTGAFFHIAGTSFGSYDLVAGTTVAASGANSLKDMANTDAAGDPFTGSWEALNATMFVKANSFDYANATVEAAAAAYANGTASAAVSNPVANDIYIAKLRGTNDYAVIKITAVDPADNTCNCGNTGKISFDYKKA